MPARSPTRRHVRVYYEFAEEYTAIFDNNDLLATWLRLLMLAHGVWPAPAVLPRSVSNADADALASAGLIELLQGDRFRVRGVDKERGPVRDRARSAAKARWDADALQRQSGRNADAMPHSMNTDMPMPTPLEPEKDASSEDPSVPVGDEDEFRVLQFLAESGVYVAPTGGMHRRLVTLVGRRGADEVIAVMERLKQGGAKSDRQFIFGAENEMDQIVAPSKPLRGHQRSVEEVERAFRQ